jgi:hypothetical protein
MLKPGVLVGAIASADDPAGNFEQDRDHNGNHADDDGRFVEAW